MKLVLRKHIQTPAGQEIVFCVMREYWVLNPVYCCDPKTSSALICLQLKPDFSSSIRPGPALARLL